MSNPNTPPQQPTIEQLSAALASVTEQLQQSLEEIERLKESNGKIVENLKKELESVRGKKSDKRKFLDDTSSSQGYFNEEPEPSDNSEEEEDDQNQTTKRIATLEAQNRKILNLLTKLPGVPVAVAVEAVDGYAQSPFVDELARIRIPKKVNIPPFTKLYDGSTDPVDHVAQYKQRMWQLSIPFHKMEATMCKSFGATLCGPALQWLINLKPHSISNFSSMVNKFYRQFASSRPMKKQSSDLYHVIQKPEEPTRAYLDRFNREMITIQGLDMSTAIEAFRMGLLYQSRLYYELTRYPCATFEEVQARAIAEIRAEEDDAFLLSKPELTGTATPSCQQ